LPSISKKVRWLASPTWSMSVVRRHFWQSASRLPAGWGRPSRYGTSGCTPAVVNSTEGSPPAMREALGRMACPRSAKNARNIDRSLSASIIPATVAASRL
jgi:hypothetical protein